MSLTGILRKMKKWHLRGVGLELHSIALKNSRGGGREHASFHGSHFTGFSGTQIYFLRLLMMKICMTGMSTHRKFASFLWLPKPSPKDRPYKSPLITINLVTNDI